MTGIIYNKKINKIISLVLITALFVLEVFYRNVNADRVYIKFLDTYGKTYQDEDFYLWTRVEPGKNGNDLYTALESYKNGSKTVQDEYASGERTFRVLLTQQLCSNMGSFASSIGSITPNSGGAWDGYVYTGYAYVQADYTREVYETDHKGEAVYRPSSNPQIQVGRDSFVTRGPQRGFICKVDKENKGYRFYCPDIQDKDPFLTLTFANTGSTGNEIWMYDDKGVAWGRETTSKTKYTDPNGKFTKSHVQKDAFCHSTDIWYVKKSETKPFSSEDKKLWRGDVQQQYYYAIYADYNSKDFDAAFLELSDNGFDCHRYNMYSDSRAYDDWMIYVGEKVDAFDLLVPGDNKPLTGARTIDKPTYVKFDETYTVESDGVLFIDNLLVLNGKLVNKGIIVLEAGSRIMQWDKNCGCIENYGDIILRDQSHIFVEELKTDNGQLILNAPIFANKLNITNSVVEYKNKEAALKNVEWINEHWSALYFDDDRKVNLYCTITRFIKFASPPSDGNIDSNSNIVIPAK